MDLPSIRKPGGRPPTRKVKDGDRVPLSLRVSPEVKKRLDNAAEYTGRSQSQEAEYRLMRSFEHQLFLTEALALRHGPKGAAVMLVLSDALRILERLVAHLTLKEGGNWPIENWLDDPRCYEAAVAALTCVLKDLHPASAGISRAPDGAAHSWEHVGAFAASVAMVRTLSLEIGEHLPGERQVSKRKSKKGSRR